MRFLETKTHGYLDYIMGALLIAAPWIFDFNRNGAETWVPVIIGAAMIGLALMTDYELGASRQISMRTHLIIDFIAGAFLATSPWIFDFDEYVWQPHLILGILEMGAALFTKRHPSTERHHRNTAVAH